MKKITHSREKKQPKVKVEMTGTGLTIYGGLLPVFNFMKALKFREKVWKEVGIDRGANARYEMVDAIEMIVIGLMAGATAMDCLQHPEVDGPVDGRQCEEVGCQEHPFLADQGLSLLIPVL